MEYPSWKSVSPEAPLALVHQEIDALRARLDAAGIPAVEVTDKEPIEQESVDQPVYETHAEV
jgi:hypothetical protein